MTLRSSTHSLTLSSFPIILTILAVAAGVTTGCGSNGSSPSTSPKLSGNTSVTVVLSSTANDQLSELGIVIQGISLTSQSGKNVSLLSTAQGAEFMDVNGGAKPFITTSIPQDVYTTATVTVGSAEFTCNTLTPSGGLDTSTFSYGQTPASQVTVTVPSPITVTGSGMGLSINLMVSQSVTYSSCYDPNGIYTYSITPTFTVTPITFSSQPTNSENGKVTNLDGEVTAIGTTGNTFTLTPFLGALTCPCPTGGPTLSITPDSNTVYQGIGNVSALTVGSFVDMDGAIQSDGSLRAMRISVEDTNTFGLSVLIGPILQTSSYGPMVIALGRQQAGYFSTTGQAAVWMPYNFGNSVFQISGQLTNLQNLPFVASFNGTNMVDGQNVSVTTQAAQFTGYPYIPAATITLMPQTINGTVVGSSTSGGFTDYTVSLANDDLFPVLAAQPNQTAVLNNASQVEVYVDSNTQMLNTTVLALGSTLRFNGLVFNDNGTLRMDCARVNDGVTGSSQSSVGTHLATGESHTVHHEGAGRLPQTTTVVAR